MIQALLPFITAIALSGIAAFYSVIGLAQIFPGSFWPVVIMGSVLEVAKLVTVSWLYNNWKKTNKLMKGYFLSAIVLLMLITSMGIFGFLSRAHIESNIVVGANSVQLQTLNTQEKIAKDRLDYLLNQAKDPTKSSARLDRDIRNTQNELTRISKEKLPLLTEENKLSAEIGPIKYIAELLYTKEDPDFIDKAVRAVIIVIIFVFDPLAVILLIAANQTFRELSGRKRFKIKKYVDRPIQSSVSSNSEIIPKNEIVKINSGDLK
jgi:hypothetical protein